MILLSDLSLKLSLKTFQVTKSIEDGDDFVRDLAPLDTESVYLPYSVGINVAADAADPDAVAAKNPAGVPGVNYGDGGSGRNSYAEAGAAGRSGIVIVRFPRQITVSYEEPQN